MGNIKSDVLRETVERIADALIAMDYVVNDDNATMDIRTIDGHIAIITVAVNDVLVDESNG